MTDIRNSNEMKNFLERKAEEALNAAADEILRIFKRDYIWKYAYIKSPKEYDRTGEFDEAWDFTELKKSVMTISKELWYNPDKVRTFSPKKFVHGSIYSSPNFVGDNLPAILEGKRSRLWISVERKTKFWEKFIADMFSGGNLEKIITKHFLAKGFTKV